MQRKTTVALNLGWWNNSHPNRKREAGECLALQPNHGDTKTRHLFVILRAAVVEN